MMKPTVISLLAALSLLFTGCVRAIAVSTVGSVVDHGFTALTEEGDLSFAAQALPGNLKLLDVMLKNQPDNTELLLLGSQGYNSYALAFVEDTSADRARAFYLRGRDYAMRVLKQDDDWARALNGTPDQLKAFLAGQDDKEMVPAVFWTAFGWGSYIYLSLSDPDAIGDLPRAEMLMQWVAAHDSAYYFGGAHVFLGTLYGSRPRILGGNPELAKSHFEKALAINGGKFLMTYVYYARSYAVQTQNEALFEELLTRVNDASLDILPEYRLANAVAKNKAQMLLAKKSELF